MKKTIVSLAVISLLTGFAGFSGNAKAQEGILDKGCVSFTVDDNESSIYNLMYPALKKYNFPATAYVVTDWVGTKNHMSWSQLKNLQSKGKWEIGNHTKSHKDLTQLSSKDMKNQISKAQSALTRNGIKKPVAFAAPYGEFNDQVVSVLKSLGFTSNRWAWSEFGKFNEPGDFDPFGITVVSLKSPLDFASAKKLIDEAASEKKWLVFVLHGIVEGPAGDYEFSASDLQKTADYLNSLKTQGAVDVKTVSQAVNLVNQSSGSASATSNSSSSQSSSSSSSTSQSVSISITSKK